MKKRENTVGARYLVWTRQGEGFRSITRDSLPLFSTSAGAVGFAVPVLSSTGVSSTNFSAFTICSLSFLSRCMPLTTTQSPGRTPRSISTNRSRTTPGLPISCQTTRRRGGGVSFGVSGVLDRLSFLVPIHEHIDTLLAHLDAVDEFVLADQRPFANHHRPMGIADRQPNPHKQPVVQQMVLVLELGPERQRASVVINPVVGEVDDAPVIKLVVPIDRQG